MKAKHTSGPCRLARYGMGKLEFWIVDADNRLILDMALAQPAKTTDEMFANGLLWAASGDLLAMLQVVLDCVDYTAGACKLNEPVSGVLPQTVISFARAAIAKARGKAAKKGAEAQPAAVV